MATVTIGNPGINAVNATSADDRYAGVNKVRNDGTVTTRKEAGLISAQGYSDVPTYVVPFNVAATVAMDIISLSPPGAGKVVRLRRIVLVNPGSATAAILVDFSLGRASGFGSGGTTPSCRSLDANVRGAGQTGGPDADIGAAHAGDTTLAGAFAADMYAPLVTVSVPAAAAGFTPLTIYDASDPRAKPLTCSSGAIVLRTTAVGAGATGLRGYVEFTVDDA